MCFIFHKWEKWEQYTETGTMVALGILYPKEVRGSTQNYSEMRQRRKCTRCGLVQDVIIK